MSPDTHDLDEVQAALVQRRSSWPVDDGGALLEEAARIVEDDIAVNGPPIAARPLDWPPAGPSLPVGTSARTPRTRAKPARPEGRHRPRRVHGRGQVAIALTSLCIIALLVIGLIASAVAFSGLVWLWVLVPFGVAAVAILGAAVTDTPIRCTVIFLLLGMVPAVVAGTAIDGSLLSIRGVVVRASITDMSEGIGRSAITFQYSLTAPDGTAIPGGGYDVSGDLGSAAPYHVGDKITVVYDPKGVVHPAAPEDAQPQSDSFAFVALAIATMIGCFVWWSVRAARRQRRTPGPV